jgi:SAM-dependent methyltransferase
LTINDSSFFRNFYESKSEYVQRRDPGSFDAQQVLLEARLFKAPNLVAVLPPEFRYESVVEIGCATGELLAEFPPSRNSGNVSIRKTGFDISPSNIEAARSRFPDIEFRTEDFRLSEITADIAILSDVLEHVPDDVSFLRAASRIARIMLVNLPLEDNWLNYNRNYGPNDISGHLRRYSLPAALQLLGASGLEVKVWRQVWIHESECETQRRSLRRRMQGAEYSGRLASRCLKAAVYSVARIARPLGRRLFASNLFASATSRASDLAK